MTCFPHCLVCLYFLVDIKWLVTEQILSWHLEDRASKQRKNTTLFVCPWFQYLTLSVNKKRPYMFSVIMCTDCTLALGGDLPVFVLACQLLYPMRVIRLCTLSWSLS